MVFALMAMLLVGYNVVCGTYDDASGGYDGYDDGDGGCEGGGVCDGRGKCEVSY